MSDIVIGIVAGSVVALISFILGLFGQIWYGKLQGKSNRQKDALKKHFADLEAIVIKPMSEIMGGVTNSEGRLWIHSGQFYSAPISKWLTKDFTEGNFHIFKLHFPALADAMTELMNKVDNHNKKCVSFDDKLTKNIKEKTGLPIRSEELPFIRGNVPRYLQQTLCYLAVKSLVGDERGTAFYDFREAEIKKELSSFKVTTKGPGAIYAEVTTVAEATSFKDAMIELMESSQLQEEMRDIYSEAGQLENVSRSLARILDFTCDQYGKYGKLLKRKKDCPVCQVIYE